MKSVLIVDDHLPVVRVLRMGLEAAGYSVDSAANGSECLLKLCEISPDFLVTDVDMPRMDGKELCLAIEKQFPQRTFPIVVLTSRTEMEHRDWTRGIENLTFMEKPVSMRRLVAHIDEALGESAEQAVG